MKRKQSDAFENHFAVMEITASSGTFVEFIPQSWIIPPKNKQVLHKERDKVKYLFPRRLPQHTKDNYVKYVKQAKFNYITSERNDKWELREGRILRMDIGSLDEALDIEKFYSDYFSTTEAETQEKEPSPPPAPKKTLRKKKAGVQPTNNSDSEDDDQGGNVSNYNISFQAKDQILEVLTLDDENAILDVNINQLLAAAVFETGSDHLPTQTYEVEETSAFERHLSTFPHEKFVTIDVPTINHPNSEFVQEEIFDDDQQMEPPSETVDQQDKQHPQTSCCKSHQRVLNKIDYVQKKLSKEMSLVRQESRSNRQLLLRVLNLLSPTDVQAEDVRDNQTEESTGGPAPQLQIDMAEVDRFNREYKATFPIVSSGAIIEFNKSLKADKTFADNLYAKLSQIKGDDEIKTTRKLLKELCGVRCLKDFTWLGTKKMKCFQDLHLVIEMLSKLLKDKFPDCNAIEIIEKVVKQRTKSAKEAYVTLLAAEEAAAKAKLDSIISKGDNDATKSDVGSSHQDVNQVEASPRKLSSAAIRENEIDEHDLTALHNANTIVTALTVQHNDVNQCNVGFSNLKDNQVAGTARKESDGNNGSEQQSA